MCTAKETGTCSIDIFDVFVHFSWRQHTGILGSRLLEAGFLNEAVVCFILGGDVDRALQCWHQMTFKSFGYDIIVVSFDFFSFFVHIQSVFCLVSPRSILVFFGMDWKDWFTSINSHIGETCNSCARNRKDWTFFWILSSYSVCLIMISFLIPDRLFFSLILHFDGVECSCSWRWIDELLWWFCPFDFLFIYLFLLVISYTTWLKLDCAMERFVLYKELLSVVYFLCWPFSIISPSSLPFPPSLPSIYLAFS